MIISIIVPRFNVIIIVVVIYRPLSSASVTSHRPRHYAVITTVGIEAIISILCVSMHFLHHGCFLQGRGLPLRRC